MSNIVLARLGENIKASTTGQVASSTGSTTAPSFGLVTPSQLSQPPTLETAKSFNWNGSTTNTVLDFTGIPSWVRNIRIMFNRLSLNGSNILVQLGTSSGIDNVNYASGSSRVASLGATGYGGATNGFNIGAGAGGEEFSGIMDLGTLGSNVWTAAHSGVVPSAGSIATGGGSKTLAAILTQVRITSQSTTNIIDAGSVNIYYTN